MRGPSRRRPGAGPAESVTNQANEPAQTPASRTSAAAREEPTTLAVDAAEKIAAQAAIVIGFDAVAPSEVRKARRGEETSSAASPPSRMRKALHSVFRPSRASTTAP